MKKISIFTFLNIIFSITIILFFVLLYMYIQVDKEKFQISQNKRYYLMMNNLKNTQNENILELFYDKLNLEKISDTNQQLKIIKKAKNIYHNTISNTTMDILNLDNKNYIYIKNYNLIFIDDPKMNYNISHILIVAIGILLLLAFLYFMLLQKLKPLKLLDENITKFKKGNFIINSNIDSKDEIGKIHENFNQAIENINYLIESKNLFMRNIMHELKTPITKGLFLANMIETKDTNDKDELINNLYNMDNILKELTNIDKFHDNITNLVLEDIDIKLLLKDINNNFNSKSITINDYSNTNFCVNKELFFIALKNLIDNGIKYSIDSKVIVDIDNKQISIKSKGNKLNKDLEYYTQAFTQEYKNSKGFGLGLYIVSEIVKLHKFSLQYKYNDEYNIFNILLTK